MAVAKLFFDVNMGLGIPGLTNLAREKRTRPGDGKYLLFMNRKRTKVKILLDEQTLVTYSKASGVITIEELKALPLTFKGEWISSSIEAKLTSWLKRPETLASELVQMAS